jgi:hypothetical protein
MALGLEVSFPSAYCTRMVSLFDLAVVIVAIVLVDTAPVRIYRNIPYNNSLNTLYNMYYVPYGIPLITR